MRAEFVVESKRFMFEAPVIDGAPLHRVAIKARPCPLKPAQVYALQYDHIDAAREVAVYRTLGIEP